MSLRVCARVGSGRRRRQAARALLSALLLVAAPSACAAPPAPLTFEEDMTREQSERLIAAIEANPERADPYQWAILATREFGRGNRLRGAFWFYMFQIRSRPWARADERGDGAAALRGALNAEVGEVINGWLGADPSLFEAIPRRAIAYEAKLPLFPDRPEGMAEADWLALVARERAAYAAEADAAFAGLDPAETAAARRANGLPVGPLTDGGAPLLDDWR